MKNDASVSRALGKNVKSERMKAGQLKYLVVVHILGILYRKSAYWWRGGNVWRPCYCSG